MNLKKRESDVKNNQKGMLVGSSPRPDAPGPASFPFRADFRLDLLRFGIHFSCSFPVRRRDNTLASLCQGFMKFTIPCSSLILKSCLVASSKVASSSCFSKIALWRKKMRGLTKITLREAKGSEAYVFYFFVDPLALRTVIG